MSDEVNDKKKESWRYKEGQRDKEVECLVYEHEVGGDQSLHASASWCDESCLGGRGNNRIITQLREPVQLTAENHTEIYVYPI